MAVYDDPNFVKALKLLHSPAPDSADQILRMLEEAIEQKYGGAKSLNMKLRNILEEPSMSLEVPKSRGSRGASPVLLGISEKSSRSSTPPSEPISIRSSPDHDGDLALQIFEDDLFCVVCKGIRVTSDNRLIECHECHLLYHQECHKPPVDDDVDVDDPRLIWYCADCTKKVEEKAAAKAKIAEPPPKKHKSDSDKSESKSSHKRGEKSSSHSSKSHSSSSSSKSSSSGSSSSKSESRSKSSGSSLTFSKPPGSPNGKGGSAPAPANIMAADKRLQNMKKKAAAKMQEKRTNHK